MRCVVVAVVLAAGPAAADGITFRVDDEEEAEPLLTLDPALVSNMQGLTGERERHDTTISIGDTHVILEGIAMANVDRPGRVTEDLESRGWRAAVHVTRKIGPFDFDAWGSVEEGQNRYARGTSRDIGVSLTKRFTLSRWMKAFVSLSIVNHKWLGDGPPPPGEVNDTKFMLSLGTTFR